MGSVVEYRCKACSFSSGHLSLGWGKSGRAQFWGGLAHCVPCGVLGVADIARVAPHRDQPLCAQCEKPLTLLEGTSASVDCPRCRLPLRFTTIGTWS